MNSNINEDKCLEDANNVNTYNSASQKYRRLQCFLYITYRVIFFFALNPEIIKLTNNSIRSGQNDSAFYRNSKELSCKERDYLKANQNYPFDLDKHLGAMIHHCNISFNYP